MSKIKIKQEKQSKNVYRQRIIEAIVYFSNKVKKPNKTVIYKMLATLDFRHFAKTGFPVTELEYEAYKRGPVPAKLHKEITVGKDVILPKDFAEALICMKSEYGKTDGSIGTEFIFRPKRKPNLEIFTPRQIDIMQEVVDIYLEANARMASDASHEKNTPWYITVKLMGKEGELIDMVETIKLEKPIAKEIIRKKLEEKMAMVYNYAHPDRG